MSTSTIGYINNSPDIVYRIDLPDVCKDSENHGDYPKSGILSTSWSHDGQKLAIVCGDDLPGFPKLVCIIPLNGDHSCWDESASEGIYRAVWSPSEDRLVISGPPDPSSRIYLVNPDGTNPVFLADGWSPEWSPDGRQIAFIHFKPITDPQHGDRGIAVINKDGSNQRLLFYPNPAGNGDDVIFFDCMSIGGTCRLAWSPDGRYIAFVSSDLDIYNYRLYRLDIKTGKIIILLDNTVFDWAIAEPDWGP